MQITNYRVPLVCCLLIEAVVDIDKLISCYFVNRHRYTCHICERIKVLICYGVECLLVILDVEIYAESHAADIYDIMCSNYICSCFCCVTWVDLFCCTPDYYTEFRELSSWQSSNDWDSPFLLLSPLSFLPPFLTPSSTPPFSMHFCNNRLNRAQEMHTVIAIFGYFCLQQQWKFKWDDCGLQEHSIPIQLDCIIMGVHHTIPTGFVSTKLLWSGRSVVYAVAVNCLKNPDA